MISGTRLWPAQGARKSFELSPRVPPRTLARERKFDADKIEEQLAGSIPRAVRFCESRNSTRCNCCFRRIHSMTRPSIPQPGWLASRVLCSSVILLYLRRPTAPLLSALRSTWGLSSLGLPCTHGHPVHTVTLYTRSPKATVAMGNL